MRVYHQVEPDKLAAALTNGLKRTSRGDKGDDKAIIKTDHLLDEHCPKHLKENGVSRDDNVYGYIEHDGMVVSIKTGTLVPLSTFLDKSKQPVLELHIDPHRCFVSDLDTYDALKDAVETHENRGVIERLAISYWDKVTPLDSYVTGAIRRPEVMITYDLDPQEIKQLA